MLLMIKISSIELNQIKQNPIPHYRSCYNTPNIQLSNIFKTLSSLLPKLTINSYMSHPKNLTNLNQIYNSSTLLLSQIVTKLQQHLIRLITDLAKYMNTAQHKIRLIQYNFLLQRLYQINTNEESHRINFVTLFEPLQKLVSHHLYEQFAGDQGDQQPQKSKVKQFAKFRPHRVKSNSLSKSLQVYHVKLTKLYNKLDQKSVKPHHKLSGYHKTLTPSNKTQTSQSPYQRKLSRKSKNLSRTFSSFSLSHQQATVIPISSLTNRPPSLSAFPKFRLSNQPQNPILQNSMTPSTNEQQNNRYRTVSNFETFGVRKQTLTSNRLPQQQVTQTTEGNRVDDIKGRQQQRQVFSFQEQLDISISPLQPNLNLIIYQKQLNRAHLKKYQQYIS